MQFGEFGIAASPATPRPEVSAQEVRVIASQGLRARASSVPLERLAHPEERPCALRAAVNGAQSSLDRRALGR